MEYEDTIAIPTPEGVALELPLAGLGSRFVAITIDIVLRLLVLAAVAIVLAVAGTPGSTNAIVFALLGFFLLFGYDVLFEVLAGGRTPGKRWSGLRVVRSGGQPVTLAPSATRNILRIADWLPASYLIGATAIVVSRRNQRLGDMAADTLVVRDRRARQAVPGGAAGPAAVAPPRGWDVSGISEEELALARQFLERRDNLEPAARAQLARQLAGNLRAKVPGAQSERSDEALIERAVAARQAYR